MSLKMDIFRFAFWLIVYSAASNAHAAGDRGYEQTMLDQGKTLFQANCAVCHGQNAEGTVENWQQRDANGKFPPPPLNGTAHTWHHPIGGLVNTIKKGTIGIGGSMPAWEDKLNNDEVFSIIVWLSSLWPDEIYNAWMTRNQQ